MTAAPFHAVVSPSFSSSRTRALTTVTQAISPGAVFGLDHDLGDDLFQHLDAIRDSSPSSRRVAFAANRRIHLRSLHDCRNVL